MNYILKDEVNINVKNSIITGELNLPEEASAIIIFSHGSGSSRNSIRNQQVAGYLNEHNFATLLLDLLTEEEDTIYQNRFDIGLLSNRLIGATRWIQSNHSTRNLNIGYFGASTGAASAIIAASEMDKAIKAIVSRGGRAELATDAISKVKSPTLLIVGSLDTHVLKMNQDTFSKLNCIKKLEVIDGATHLFQEPNKLEKVADLSNNWFQKYLNT